MEEGAHCINSSPNPKHLRAEKRKESSTESKAFSKSAENRVASVFSSSVNSSTSLINLTDSPIYLSFTFKQFDHCVSN